MEILFFAGLLCRPMHLKKNKNTLETNFEGIFIFISSFLGFLIFMQMKKTFHPITQFCNGNGSRAGPGFQRQRGKRAAACSVAPRCWRLSNLLYLESNLEFIRAAIPRGGAAASFVSPLLWWEMKE